MMKMIDSLCTLPLMSMLVIASAVSKLICPTALYQALATNCANPPALPAPMTNPERDGTRIRPPSQ